ncbi:MAG: DUF1080 domain-containing protein [Opitutae bacterium]|nr:DUF1080 domain-containing protein [Opitutae bacterium]
MKSNPFPLCLFAGFFAAALAAAEPANPPEKAAGWLVLFDGRTLDGWRASDLPGTFSVRDGELIVKGPRSHLYYTGPVADHDFRNFELSLEVKTFPRANSGVYFHTQWQEKGWPDHGYEVQVDNSHSDPSRTAGLYDVKGNYEPVAKDGQWFELRIKVVGKRIITTVDGRVVIDWTEPEGWTPPANHAHRAIFHGTFALQGHDPGSEVHYRNIRVRLLP